ncbi:MAG: tRNA guanosine(34) transglycosylase Tgt [Patescibacteria group bacterium]
MFFSIIHRDKNSRARTGIIHTDHGDIETPIFMPVGTQGTVKSVDNDDLREIGAQIILGNTYHLHLRPGEDLIDSFGGLHRFMNWDKPILTDSGGFQVFSLGSAFASKRTDKEDNDPINKKTTNAEKDSPTGGSSLRGVSEASDAAIPLLKSEDDVNNTQGKLVEIDEDGVTFRSYLDGSTHRFTPETATEIQRKIGADIIMAFDECTPDEVDEKYARAAMERTHRWAERSLAAHRKSSEKNDKPYRQFMFGIIQGANYRQLREKSAKAIAALNFDGIAIGGESVGYNMAATKEILDWVIPHLPETKPRYTMGVGYYPADLFTVVEQGVDMFDCVAPTRVARNGTLYIHPWQNTAVASNRTDRKRNSLLNINNARFKTDATPIDPECLCYTCAHHTRAYLHHLFKAQELLAYRLATINNLQFILNLMKEIREAINDDRFLELKKRWV